MALRTVYHPPPGWPVPPEGWEPPPGWQPDPGWGPAPEGWQLWRRERANPGAWGLAFAWAAVLLVVLLSIGSIVARRPPTPEAIGSTLARCVVAAVITGAIAWRSGSRWSVWVYLIVSVGVTVVLGALTFVGQHPGGA